MGKDSELLRPHFWGLSEVWRVNPKTGGPGTFLIGVTELPSLRGSPRVWVGTFFLVACTGRRQQEI